jgi:hypothetical protein
VTGAGEAVAALARLLAAGRDTPIELGGATAVFEAIARGPVTADVLSTSRHELTDGERELLRPGRRDIAARRRGMVRTGNGVRVAEITAVLLPRRIPGPARFALGITPAGTVVDGRCHVPLGRALRGLGVWRQQIAVTVTPGYTNADGVSLVLHSEALLQHSSPVAVVTERVCLDFLEAFPLPWTGLDSGEPAELRLTGARPCQPGLFAVDEHGHPATCGLTSSSALSCVFASQYFSSIPVYSRLDVWRACAGRSHAGRFRAPSGPASEVMPPRAPERPGRGVSRTTACPGHPTEPAGWRS